MEEQRKRRERAYRYLGTEFESEVARRERLADNYDIEFGQERVFPELVTAMLERVPEGSRVLEVGAATGLLTRPLLERASKLTAMEPSAGLLRRLLSTDVAEDPRLVTMAGVVEELAPRVAFDVAVVTFTPRRGYALVRLLHELAIRVSDRVVILLAVAGTMDWAYLARSAVLRGFGVEMELIPREDRRNPGVVMTVRISGWKPGALMNDEWAVDVRQVDVPYPSPRGAATRLIRYFLSRGDRVLAIATDARGADRLYGNLRTAAHRVGGDEVSVRRQGDVIQLVRLPRRDGAGRGSGDDFTE
ncbi:MAG TPA: hypothetical protein VGK50_06690 [Coriobacteriia bacterium]